MLDLVALVVELSSLFKGGDFFDDFLLVCQVTGGPGGRSEFISRAVMVTVISAVT